MARPAAFWPFDAPPFSSKCKLLERNNLLESIGVSIRAQKRLARRVAVTRPPSWRNMMPVAPCTKTSGRKTQMVVAVEATRERPTSEAAKREASRTRTPRPMKLVMFSKTTMALSTTMPMAMASAERLIMLMVQPMKYM